MYITHFFRSHRHIEPRDIVHVQLPAPLDRVAVPARALPGVYAALRCMTANVGGSTDTVSVDTLDKIVNYARRIGARNNDLGELLDYEQIEAILNKFHELADVSEQMQVIKTMSLTQVEQFVRRFIHDSDLGTEEADRRVRE